MELSDRIQEVLDAKGLSQADLCRISHLSSAKVSQVVSGATQDPRISTIAPISKALKVSLDYLVFGKRTKMERLDKWQEHLLFNYELLNDKGRMRLVEESEILVKSELFRRRGFSNPSNESSMAL